MLGYYYKEIAEVFPIGRQESNLEETYRIYNSPSASANHCLESLCGCTIDQVTVLKSVPYRFFCLKL